MTEDRRSPAFTGGEWQVSRNAIVAIFTMRSARVAVVDEGFYVSKQQAEANARLIAAAPDLYAACQLFLAYDRSTDADDIASMLNYAEAKEAIVRALARVTAPAESESVK